jgi:signal peptidase I
VSRIVKNCLVAVICLAIVVPAVLLVAGVLPYKVFIVHTGSMSPTIPSKSAVVVKEGAFHIGQVISYQSANGVVTHRLVRRTADGMLVTKGDANRTTDPGAVAPSRVVGGVVAAPRMLGYWLMYLKNPAGLASLFMTIVCLWLIFSTTNELSNRQQQGNRRGGGALAAASPQSRPVAASSAAECNSVRTVDLVATTRSEPNEPTARAAIPDRSDASWELAPWEAPVLFRCARCGTTFGGADELWAHADEHGDARNKRARRHGPSARCSKASVTSASLAASRRSA